MSKYRKILEDSFIEHKEMSDYSGHEAKYSFISDLFGFTTYDSEMDSKLVTKMMPVIRAIHTGTTFEFIKDPQNYEDYIVCVNFPWFEGKLDWGTSIRGAWWSHDTKNFSEECMWVDGKQIILYTDDPVAWDEMINALLQFWEGSFYE